MASSHTKAEAPAGPKAPRQGLPVAPDEPWPAIMRIEKAARYVDEPSAQAFRRGVGTLYPKRGDRWLRAELDQAIARMAGKVTAPINAADVL